MQFNKHGSFYIRNGWPTKIIDAINENARIFSPAFELNAVDAIGVGRVMIKAMRYWTIVLGISIEEKDQQGVYSEFTPLGQQIAAHDPYCADYGTLWLLHRNLTREAETATIWNWAFNKCSAKAFTKEEFVNDFCTYIHRCGEVHPKNSIEKEFDCFKNTYVSEKKFGILKIIDEDTVPFFAPLNLLRHLGAGKFEKVKVEAKNVPLDILLYCIIADNEQHLADQAELDIDMLLEDENQVGKYMNLSYSTLLELLQQLENRSELKLINNFGSRYIHLESTNANEILERYYQGIEG